MSSQNALLTHFVHGDSEMGIVTKGFDANRPFLVFDFLAHGRSGLSVRVPESQKPIN